ncbi:hypothetical protein K490DRAFT_56464 [Saccharata proteae CBS 121410]|uniref:Uncharacterized protein n=1 Tax=Saccharata proteae CBS 121410 TaxID=1314787 RepID=A0A9P4LZ95_9PEZI|nr:hypothetical protein K490DRAFT_56464 [Saccharata proteae CBS 121410]
MVSTSVTDAIHDKHLRDVFLPARIIAHQRRALIASVCQMKDAVRGLKYFVRGGKDLETLRSEHALPYVPSWNEEAAKQARIARQMAAYLEMERLADESQDISENDSGNESGDDSQDESQDDSQEKSQHKSQDEAQLDSGDVAGNDSEDESQYGSHDDSEAESGNESDDEIEYAIDIPEILLTPPDINMTSIPTPTPSSVAVPFQRASGKYLTVPDEPSYENLVAVRVSSEVQTQKRITTSGGLRRPISIAHIETFLQSTIPRGFFMTDIETIIGYLRSIGGLSGSDVLSLCRQRPTVAEAVFMLALHVLVGYIKSKKPFRDNSGLENAEEANRISRRDLLLTITQNLPASGTNTEGTLYTSSIRRDKFIDSAAGGVHSRFKVRESHANTNTTIETLKLVPKLSKKKQHKAVKMEKKKEKKAATDELQKKQRAKQAEEARRAQKIREQIAAAAAPFLRY